jgi:hypothetical protein
MLIVSPCVTRAVGAVYAGVTRLGPTGVEQYVWSFVGAVAARVRRTGSAASDTGCSTVLIPWVGEPVMVLVTS